MPTKKVSIIADKGTIAPERFGSVRNFDIMSLFPKKNVRSVRYPCRIMISVSDSTEELLKNIGIIQLTFAAGREILIEIWSPCKAVPASTATPLTLIVVVARVGSIA